METDRSFAFEFILIFNVFWTKFMELRESTKPLRKLMTKVVFFKYRVENFFVSCLMLLKRWKMFECFTHGRWKWCGYLNLCILALAILFLFQFAIIIFRWLTKDFILRLYFRKFAEIQNFVYIFGIAFSYPFVETIFRRSISPSMEINFTPYVTSPWLSQLDIARSRSRARKGWKR